MCVVYRKSLCNLICYLWTVTAQIIVPIISKDYQSLGMLNLSYIQNTQKGYKNYIYAIFLKSEN